MKNKRMNNKGFSLIELIIVIAIMAVLLVVLVPQYLQYVEKAKRARDANSALEMRNVFDRVLAMDSTLIYKGGPGSAYRSDNGNYVAVLSADGSDAGYVSVPLLAAALDELGECPISATFKNGMWAVEIDPKQSNVVRIELIELTAEGPPVVGGSIQGYEGWPDSHAFCACEEPTDAQIYNHITYVGK